MRQRYAKGTETTSRDNDQQRSYRNAENCQRCGSTTQMSLPRKTLPRQQIFDIGDTYLIVFGEKKKRHLFGARRLYMAFTSSHFTYEAKFR